MAEPSQLQAAGVKRSDIPGNVPHKADPEGIAAACDRKTSHTIQPFPAALAAIPLGSSIEVGNPGVSRVPC